MSLSRIILEQLNSNNPTIERNLILYHGSGEKNIKEFNDNQFFSVNEELARSYSENNGGDLYQVRVKRLNPLFLKGYYVLLGGKRNMMTEEPQQYKLEYDLLSTMYGQDEVKNWLRYGFYPSPAYILDGNWEPTIEYAKKRNYDSLKFYDESFDSQFRALSYMIFDPKKIEIMNIMD